MPSANVLKARLKQDLLTEAAQMLQASITTLSLVSLDDLRRGQAMLLAKVVIDLEGVKNRLDNVLTQDKA